MAKSRKTEAKVPTHRAMIDLRTGRNFEPVVPISPEDLPHRLLPPWEVLWRYMDSRKFEDLLVRSALYFSRPDKFIDPFEGRLSPANANTMSASDAAFCAAYRIQRPEPGATESREIMRRCVFISCWHRATQESRNMWNAYTPGPDSVVIVSSAYALDRFVQGRIVKSPVWYHDDDFPRTEFDHTTLFFYKPLRYSFEREFRMLLSSGEDESINYSDFGRHVPVSLKRIIHRVITHPRASGEFKAKVDGCLTRYLRSVSREDSNLLP